MSAAAELRFDERVAVVTGAGGGLGRTYALLLAKKGAKVVVNDLGASADKVVEEIRAAGGEAVADKHSVEDGEAVVGTALSTYGRIDILIANAGILRDASFLKMTDDQWDMVYRVHLRGTYKCVKAAWSPMREAGYGRILLVSSSTGLYGNFGQANYGAMKLGILGFANVLALEGSKRGVLVNTIAPVAATAMTEGLMPPDLLAALQPEAVAPVAAYLCHERCTSNGGIFELGGGWVSKLRWQRSAGAFVPPARLTLEAVAAAWDAVEDFEHPAGYPTSNQDAFAILMQHLGGGAGGASVESNDSGASVAATAGGGSSSSGSGSGRSAVAFPSSSEYLAPLPGGNAGSSEAIDVPRVVNYIFPTLSTRYSERDAALYALSVGACGPDALDDRDLPFVYELAGPGLRVMPAFATLFPHNNAAALAGVPGMRFDPMMLLHGEQEVVLPSGALPPAATVLSQSRIANVYDKGSGALVVLETVSVEEASGRVLCVNRNSLFLRGVGGFGGSRGPAAAAWSLPARAPDVVQGYCTARNQALLYRLNGDTNPLHADPAMAAAGGFAAPILHGLCSLGICVRILLREFGRADPARMTSFKARFTKHVFPGETVVCEAWDAGVAAGSGSGGGVRRQRVLFQARVQERKGADGKGELVLIGGEAEFTLPEDGSNGALLRAKL